MTTETIAWQADRDYPRMIAETDHVEPARGECARPSAASRSSTPPGPGTCGNGPYYPQYYIPVDDDIDPRFLVDEKHDQHLRQGAARRHGPAGRRSGPPRHRPGLRRDAIDVVAGTALLDWDALDAWYEEDEQVSVHPRNPYGRVDALRSHRQVRASLEGIMLAETSRPVLVAGL